MWRKDWGIQPLVLELIGSVESSLCRIKYCPHPSSTGKWPSLDPTYLDSWWLFQHFSYWRLWWVFLDNAEEEDQGFDFVSNELRFLWHGREGSREVGTHHLSLCKVFPLALTLLIYSFFEGLSLSPLYFSLSPLAFDTPVYCKLCTLGLQQDNNRAGFLFRVKCEQVCGVGEDSCAIISVYALL